MTRILASKPVLDITIASNKYWNLKPIEPTQLDKMTDNLIFSSFLHEIMLIMHN